MIKIKLISFKNLNGATNMVQTCGKIGDKIVQKIVMHFNLNQTHKNRKIQENIKSTLKKNKYLTLYNTEKDVNSTLKKDGSCTELEQQPGKFYTGDRKTDTN